MGGEADKRFSNPARAAPADFGKTYSQLPGLISASIVLLIGVCVCQFVTLGPLSRHMSGHIALMSVAAPICAAMLWLALPAPRQHQANDKALWALTIGQMVLLWVWHVPPVHAATMIFPWLEILLYGLLFCIACLFWFSVLSSTGGRWQSIFALLATAKLACLLGALLVFSPRLLYPLPLSVPQHTMHPAAERPDLADQHFAGLLMIAACPLSYLLAGVVLAAQLMTALGRASTLGDRNVPATR